MVESADGFEWFELLRPVEGTDRYLVYTRWRSEEDFKRWQQSQAFQAGHAQAAQAAGQEQGQGQGARPWAGPGRLRPELWSFEVVQSAGPKSGSETVQAPVGPSASRPGARQLGRQRVGRHPRGDARADELAARLSGFRAAWSLKHATNSSASPSRG